MAAVSSNDAWLHHVKQSVLCENAIQRPRSVCIYRVPKPLMDIKKEAYVPRLVQLGPYYDRLNCAPLYSEMENHKLRALRKMMSRLSDKDINCVIAQIQELEKRIRDCYDEKIDCNGETLAWMFALDGCFILEVMRTFPDPCRGSGNPDLDYFEPIFDPKKIGFSQGWRIRCDIMMLENQIPLFVLSELLQLEMGLSPQAAMLFNFLEEVSPFKIGSEGTEVLSKHMEDSGHLLDLLRRLVIESCFKSPPVKFDKDNPDYRVSVPSAEKLKTVGIGFEKSGEGQYSIAFRKNKLFSATICLPQIVVTDRMDTILGNLIAFEEMQGGYGENIISRYVSLMNDLIDTAKDVEVLKKEQIILSALGNDHTVAQVFNDFGEGFTVTQINGIDHFIKDVNEHYGSRFRVLVAEFIEAKVAKPWIALSVVGAILILIMTALQVFYSARYK